MLEPTTNPASPNPTMPAPAADDSASEDAGEIEIKCLPDGTFLLNDQPIEKLEDLLRGVIQLCKEHQSSGGYDEAFEAGHAKHAQAPDMRESNP